jgi:hypothetical protein
MYSSIGHGYVSQQAEGDSDIPYLKLLREQDNLQVEYIISSFSD